MRILGHGSCFRHSPFLGYLHEAVPRRLACPVVLSRISPSRPSGSPRSLPRARDCGEPREVPPRAFSGVAISRSSEGHQVFQGFSIDGSRRQATVNSWRISVLRRSSSQYLALASRHALLTLPSSSGRKPLSEVPPALSPQILGSVGQDPLVSGLPQGSPVVASPSPSVVRGVSAASLSRSGLLVRRLRRGLGSSFRFTHRFRPLESGSKRSLYKRQGASSHPRGSPPLPVFSGREECVSVLRQQHSSVVSPQGRRHQVSIPQLSDSRDSVLGRIPLDPPVTPVHPGVPKCAGGLSLSPSPASTYRVVPSSGGFSFFKSSVAGPNRLYAISANCQCSVYFFPFRDPMAAGTDAFLQSWDGLQAYAFPPWSVIP